MVAPLDRRRTGAALVEPEPALVPWLSVMTGTAASVQVELMAAVVVSAVVLLVTIGS